MTRRSHPAWLRRRRRGTPETIIEEFSRALTEKDDEAVRRLLHGAVTLVIDSGGHLNTATIPLHGRSAASSELLALMTAGTTAVVASVNGVAGLTLMRDDRVVGVITGEFRSCRLSGMWVVCNPEKLRHWNRATPQAYDADLQNI